MSKTVTATEAKNNFGEMVKWAKENTGGIYIRQYGEPTAVLLGVEEFEELKEKAEEFRLAKLVEEIERVRRVAFDSLPDELKQTTPAEILGEAGFSEDQIREIIELDQQLSGKQ